MQSALAQATSIAQLAPVTAVPGDLVQNGCRDSREDCAGTHEVPLTQSVLSVQMVRQVPAALQNPLLHIEFSEQAWPTSAPGEVEHKPRKLPSR